MGKNVTVYNQSKRPYVRDKYLFPPREKVGPINMTERDIFGMKTTKFLKVSVLDDPKVEVNGTTEFRSSGIVIKNMDELKDMRIYELRSLASQLGCEFGQRTKKVDFIEMIKEKRAGD